MLSFQVLTGFNGELLADFTAVIKDLKFSTNCHGFLSCSGFIPDLSLDAQFAIYDWPDLPHVVVKDNSGATIFEGRLEDISLTNGGVELVAFGYFRAFSDLPYTALWSTTDYSQFINGTEDDNSNFAPSKFQFDNNNRLFIGLVKDADYSASQMGNWLMYSPDEGEKLIKRITFDYEFNGATNYRILVVSYTTGFSGSTEWSVNGDSTTQSGSATVTLTTARDRVAFGVQRISSDNTYTGETGDTFGKFTNVRVMTEDSSTIYASDIVEDVVTFIDGINDNQLSIDFSKVTATSTDLTDALFEDEYPSDFLDALAFQNGFALAVWENQMVEFGVPDSQTWYVDAVELVELQRSLEPVQNSVYAKYQTENGRDLRTDVEEDTSSIDRYGITRRGVTTIKTTSLTVAELQRDSTLADNSNKILRAVVSFNKIYNSDGAEFPLYHLRANDNIVIRNLPPTLSTSLDFVTSFTIGETQYDADSNSMSLEPATAYPTLIKLIAGVS